MRVAVLESIALVPLVRPRILVIEDHPAIRMAMSNLIRHAGAEVVAARDCDEGFSYLISRRFDVLLADVTLRLCEGNELLRRCEGLPTIRRPSRVILFGGASGNITLMEAIHGDATKPFSLRVLLDMFDGRPN